MRGIHWINFLSSVFALTLGVSASTASFGKSSLGCIDYCTVEEYAKINATQQYLVLHGLWMDAVGFRRFSGNNACVIQTAILESYPHCSRIDRYNSFWAYCISQYSVLQFW